MELPTVFDKKGPFHIPSKFQRRQVDGGLLCLVPDEWLKGVAVGHQGAGVISCWSTLEEDAVEGILAPSTDKVPAGWTRICIITLSYQQGKQIPSLLGEPLSQTSANMTVTEMLAYTAARNRQNQWNSVCSQHHHQPTQESEDYVQYVDEERYLMEMVSSLYHCPVLDLDRGEFNKHMAREQTNHPNLPQPVVIIKSAKNIFIVKEFVPHTVHDCVTFSPEKLTDSYAKPLFILYQALQAIGFCHRKGVPVQSLSLKDLYIDEKLWTQLNLHNSSGSLKKAPLQGESKNLHTQRPIALDQTENLHNVHADTTLQDQNDTCAASQSNKMTYTHDIEARDLTDLGTVVQEWSEGRISNFDYLMVLNRLAGRRMGDPNHHPVMPWVSNFQQPKGGYRDLTKSKFRLNKGDHQLDLTFDIPSPLQPGSGGDSMHIPHHISDVLSDITYYVYKARRTPKSVLCAHVRSKWVPNEYPSNMQRLQEWTPDECIPEFFTDPTIFTSIHEDLPDLGIPAWCSSPSDFVWQHREILEGEHVSSQLHLWIDLTFGYKLSGDAAVLAKNVCLPLVDHHTGLANHGIIQLFTEPHPPKRIVPQYMGKQWPKEIIPQRRRDMTIPVVFKEKGRKISTQERMEKRLTDMDMISLPADYDPLALLDQVEAQFKFSLTTMHTKPSQVNTQVLASKSEEKMNLVTRDVQVFGCMMAELYLAPHFHVLSPDASLTERYQKVKAIWQDSKKNVPRGIRYATEYILQLDNRLTDRDHDQSKPAFVYPMVMPDGAPPPCPDVLLKPEANIIPFPVYFAPLYTTIAEAKGVDCEITRLLQSSNVSQDLLSKIKQLRKAKLSSLARFISVWGSKLGHEGLSLFVPFALDLLEDGVAGVEAAWALFNPIAQYLGPDKTKKELLPLLTKLFDSEQPTPKHIKLYHRTFVIQLIVRLGLHTFLANFSTLLVEAVACYRNFAADDDYDHQISNEAEVLSEAEANMSELSPMEDDGIQPAPTELEGALESQIKFYIADEENGAQEDNEQDVFALDEEHMVEHQRAALNHLDSQCDNQSRLSADVSSLGRSAGDGESTQSGDAGEGPLSKSFGRHSVHSISRLIDLEKQQGLGLSPSDSQSRSRRSSNASEAEKSPVLEQNITDNGPALDARRHKREYSRSIVDALGNADYNISDVAAETIKWLAHRLGPLLTGRYLARNLLRVLFLCYLGDEQLELVPNEEDPLSTTKKQVVGDYHATQVIECLSCIAILYGEQVILLQYFTHIIDVIAGALKKLTSKTEAGLIGSLVLVTHMIPYISDSSLMDNLQETLFRDILLPVLSLIQNAHISFPSGYLTRSILCYKVIDLLCVLSLRIGREMTRKHMKGVIQTFFTGFNKVYQADNSGDNSEEVRGQGKTSDTIEDNLYFEIKMDANTNEVQVATAFDTPPMKGHLHEPDRSRSPSVCGMESQDDEKTNAAGNLHQLTQTFTPEMAHTAYIPLCKLAGGFFMENVLENDDLIHRLLAAHDTHLAQQEMSNHTDANGTEHSEENGSSTNGGLSQPEETDNVVEVFGSMSGGGNKLVVANQEPEETTPRPGTTKRKSTDVSPIDLKLKSPEMDINSHRHLKGNWLAYWEHEMGLSERDKYFNFKQIKLQTFSGHGNSVRSMYVLDNENSFISASKDKTIKLWSLRNFGDGSQRIGCQYTYSNHKKSVFAVTFLDSVRLAASCDSTVHIWDPFMGVCVKQLDSPRYSPVTLVTPLPSPHSTLITATTEATLRFLDVRACGYMHEFKCTTSPAGLVRCVSVSPDSTWAAVGYSTGVISVVDIRTGLLLASWKGHEGEVLQVRAYNNKSFVTSSFDQCMTLWNVEEGKQVCHFKGPTEPVHCFNFYNDEIVSATTANKIGVHSSVGSQAMFSSCKLRSETFRGVLTTMAVLPLNRMLLLGADNGSIKLFC